MRNRFESKDREWASYTCVLGFHVMGEEKFYPFLVVAPLIQDVIIFEYSVKLIVAMVFQVCGWKALMVLTSTHCVAHTVRR